MNNPQYILTEVFGEIAATVKAVLNIPVLNYQYGYITELNQTLQQWNALPEKAVEKFPCLWLAQPYTVARNKIGFFGETPDLRLFIIAASLPNLKAAERMQSNFKPVIYPLYSELLNQIALHPAFSIQGGAAGIAHRFIDRYFWGEDQQNMLNDIIDCSELNGVRLLINNNQNCITFSNI